MAKKNILTQGKKIKADEAAREGRLDEAATLLKSVCRMDAGDAESWVKLSLIQKGLGHALEAETCARRAVVLSPQLGLCHYALGAALHSQHRLEDAIDAYRRSIRLQPDFASSHYLLGMALHESGELALGIEHYQKALSLRPDFPEALEALGGILISVGDVEHGVAALQRVLMLQPDNITARNSLGNGFFLQDKLDEALENFRHALLLAPDSIDVIAGLAGLLEKTGELAEARNLVERGLGIDPLHPATNLVAAQLARRERRFQDAADILEKLRVQPPSTGVAGEIELSLGQIYDDLGNPEKAYPLIVSGNQKKAALSLPGEADRRKYLEVVARISRLATPTLKKCVASSISGAVSDGPDPVFLIGFPRSGTTLLEQILDSHPAIQAVGEKGTVAAMVNDFLASAGEKDDPLPDLTGADVARLRQLYFAEVKRHIDLRPGSLLLDKQALNIVKVPIIGRMFPRAKFILAIRHPCDVSLSCLMQNFAVNEGMASFFSLEDTARAYAAVMGAWRKYVDILPLDYHRIRYEDLIADVEGESRRLLEFLGVPWNDAVLDHAEHARKRGAINTPSYHQVVQPIYRHARYRWKRYEREFASVMPLLQPFISYFGYEEPGL